MAIYYHFQVLRTVHNCMCCAFIWLAGFFTLASPQIRNMLHYNVEMAATSLGDREFFWGGTAIYEVPYWTKGCYVAMAVETCSPNIHLVNYHQYYWGLNHEGDRH